MRELLHAKATAPYRQRSSADDRVSRNATTSYRPITATLSAVNPAAAAIHDASSDCIAARTSRMCTPRRVFHVSPSTTAIAITGHRLAP